MNIFNSLLAIMRRGLESPPTEWIVHILTLLYTYVYIHTHI